MTTTLDHLAQSIIVQEIEEVFQSVSNALERPSVVFSLFIGRPITITILSSEETYTFSDLFFKIEHLVKTYVRLSPDTQNFDIASLRAKMHTIQQGQAAVRDFCLLCIGGLIYLCFAPEKS